MSGTSNYRAGIYCRLSLARFGDTTKVDDQERICRGLAAQLGWPVAAVYKDNNRSAWERNRRRPGWDQMLADVAAGVINAIIVYHGDRLVRRPEDLADLLRLADDKGVKLASPTGTHDLDTQRLELWIRAAFAEEESTRNSERKKAGFERMRLAGYAPRPGGRGRRAFGYETDGRTQIPREADAIRTAAARVLAGDTLAAVCRDLDASGIRSTTGEPLVYKTLKRILLRPRTAGLLADGETPGNWEGILTADDHRRLGELFHSAPPKQAAGAKHLLPGIAECSECGHPLQRITNDGRSAYGCRHPGCRKVYRNMRALDLYVIGRVVRLLNEPDFMKAVAKSAAVPEHSGEIAALEKRRDEALETLGALADHPGASAAMLARSVAEFDRRIAALRADTATGARAHLLRQYQGITIEEFGALPLATRRAVIRAAYRIVVKPSSRRGRGFNPDDVDMELRRD